MQKGSIVICEGAHGQWYDIETNVDTFGPADGEILTVSGFQKGFLEFQEYPELQHDGLPAAFSPIYFRELQPPMKIDIESFITEKV